MLLLESALDKARRAHKPLIISRMPTSSNTSTQTNCMTADAGLLAALSMQVKADSKHGLIAHGSPLLWGARSWKC